MTTSALPPRQHTIAPIGAAAAVGDMPLLRQQLEREVKELRRANEILKLARAFFAHAELDRRLKS